LHAEVAVLVELAARFAPRPTTLPRRVYGIEALPFDGRTAEPFGQVDEARNLLREAGQADQILAFVYSPRRPGQKVPAGLVLRATELQLVNPGGERRVPLEAISALAITLSPLVARIKALAGSHELSLTYPAPAAAEGAAFVRLSRRVLAGTI
jgi:hypothetical protein